MDLDLDMNWTERTKTDDGSPVVLGQNVTDAVLKLLTLHSLLDSEGLATERVVRARQHHVGATDDSDYVNIANGAYSVILQCSSSPQETRFWS